MNNMYQELKRDLRKALPPDICKSSSQWTDKKVPKPVTDGTVFTLFACKSASTTTKIGEIIQFK